MDSVVTCHAVESVLAIGVFHDQRPLTLLHVTVSACIMAAIGSRTDIEYMYII